MMEAIPIIALEGGPGGGKSTAISYFVKQLEELGYYPIVVPESATILLNAQITFRNKMFSVRDFQEHVFDLTYSLETQWLRAAVQSKHPKPILLADRGLMSSLGYISEEMFLGIAKDRNFDVPLILSRYIVVIHLCTAALGAEEFYTLANNSVRNETPEEARHIDHGIRTAWKNHSSQFVIDNRGKSITVKLFRAWRKTCRVLGEPIPRLVRKKRSFGEKLLRKIRRIRNKLI